MAGGRKGNRGVGSKTMGSRGVGGLPATKFSVDDWVVFQSEERDRWIGGTVKNVDRKMYTAHDYDVEFTKSLSIQVIPYRDGTVESKAEWVRLRQSEWWTLRETDLERNVPNLRQMLDQQLDYEQI